MPQRSLAFRWRPVAPVTVYVYLAQPGRPKVTVHSGAWCGATLQSPEGCITRASVAGSPVVQADRMGPGGVWAVTIEPGPEPQPDSPEVELCVETTIGYPFTVPGPGVVPSHFPFPEPLLRLAADPRRPVDLWLWVAPGLRELTLQTLFAPERVPELVAPDESRVALKWMPNTGAQRSVQIEVNHSGWWRCPVAPGIAGWLTTWQGAPLFAEPAGELPVSRLVVRPQGADGQPIAARVELSRNGRRWAICDVFAGSEAELHTLPGAVEVAVSQGFSHLPATRVMALAEGTTAVDIGLAPGVAVPQGWLCGDHHVHSYCEDGGQPPTTIAKTAAAQGLDYVFITDEPEPLYEEGFDRYNVPGVFMALPGQECTNGDAHCNALNVERSVARRGHDGRSAEQEGPTQWLEEVARQSAKRPALLMLNHPSHLPPASQAQRYFRSWAQVDHNPGITLVENCDFASWFARLNTGRRLTALWTTDSHDMAWFPAGARRSYVYVGDLAGRAWTDADVIAALASGRVTNTRQPGAFLLLTVEQRLPGEEVAAGERPLRVQLSCWSSRPLVEVELIVNGMRHMSWSIGQAQHLAVDLSLRLPAGWVLARAYAHAEPWPQDSHRMEPMTATGCVAFTNPVYLI